jgi:proteic killer suppression protein
VIKSFADKRTAAVFQGLVPKGFAHILASRAQIKLALLDSAASLDDLRAPPGNRLEALKGARRGQHSIRINDQWRICFVWQGGNAHEVEIADYH